MGILPPEGQEWTIGKTAATIKFVEDAESYLKAPAFLRKKERKLLENAISNAKNGTLVLIEWTDIEDYLEQQIKQ